MTEQAPLLRRCLMTVRKVQLFLLAQEQTQGLDFVLLSRVTPTAQLNDNKQTFKLLYVRAKFSNTKIGITNVQD